MTESFPRQEARTRRFTLGVPRTFRVSPDGARVTYLRTNSGTDPVTCLWVLDVGSGQERLAADPRTLGLDEEDLPPQERARRERVREQAGGIVAYATDQAVTMAAFAVSGRVYAVPLTGEGGPGRQMATRTPALDPRPDPAGRRLAYVCAGALRVTGLTDALEDQVIADPRGAEHVTFGLPEFIAAEEMDRHRGYWWAPDGSALLVARVDETPVTTWHIADPARPDRPAAEVAYPAAGTPNADVSVLLARLDGTSADVETDRAAFPYLVTACWQDGHDPLVVVQSRDQRVMRILGVEPGSGKTRVLHEDTDPRWLEVVPGVPAWTRDGRIVWTRDDGDTRRLVLMVPGSEPVPVTPPGLQVRGVGDVDGDTVPFVASSEPTEIGLWSLGPSGLNRVGAGQGVQGGQEVQEGDGGDGVEGGTLAGGTAVTWRRALDHDGVTVRAYRNGSLAATIASLAEHPALPAPRPIMLRAGPHEIRTAVLFPSWHRPGQGRLPVLLDPYGGPHGQRVVQARDTYLTSQWFAEQGFAVMVADGRGTPGRGPRWERAVAGDLAGPPLDDQIEALRAAAGRFGELDTSRVAIRGWSFGGYLAALAVLRRPDVFHAAVAGAPVTDWRLYDTHYTERYLGHPDTEPDSYNRSSLIYLAERTAERTVVTPAGGGSPAREEALAGGTRPAPGDDPPESPATGGTHPPASPVGPSGSPRGPRPLLLIHGLADDNVVVAHTLRLSAALLAAGYPHSVLPLSGITHMASQETVAENLLLLQLDFLRRALGVQDPGRRGR